MASCVAFSTIWQVFMRVLNLLSKINCKYSWLLVDFMRRSSYQRETNTNKQERGGLLNKIYVVNCTWVYKMWLSELLPLWSLRNKIILMLDNKFIAFAQWVAVINWKLYFALFRET